MCRILLLAALVGHLGFWAEAAGPVGLQTAAAGLAAKNTLNYGDTCSVSDEKKRADLNRKLLDALVTMDQSRFSAMGSEISSTLRSLSGNLCNEKKLLQCGSGGKCACGSTEIGGMRVESSREGASCRLNRGSSCMPAESLAALGAGAPDLKCKARTSCALKRDRTPCTRSSMMEEVMSSIDRSKGFPDPTSFMRQVQEKMKEGICQCG